MRWMTVAVLATAASAAYLASRKRRGYGSATNASDAVDDIELGSNPSTEDLVDASVMGTFPASDPPATDDASETAYARRQRAGSASRPAQPQPAPARSPDWLLHPPGSR